MPPLYISDKFCDAPVIEAANQGHPAAVGVYVRGLNWAAHHLSKLSGDWCLPRGLVLGMFLDPDKPSERRATKVLEDLGLWEPLIRPGTKTVREGWRVPQNGLWKFGPLSTRRPIRNEIRAAVVARDGMVCQLCGGDVGSPAELHIDHILPVVHGGGNSLDNLQVAHARCNLSKGARRG